MSNKRIKTDRYRGRLCAALGEQRTMRRFNIVAAIAICLVFLAFDLVWLHIASAKEWERSGAPAVFLAISILVLTVVLVLASRGLQSFDELRFVPLPVLLLLLSCAQLAVFFTSDMARMFAFLHPEALPPPPHPRLILNMSIKAIGLYFALVVGMAAKWCWDELHLMETTRHRKFKLLKLGRPLLISPIVFLVIWLMLRDQPVGLVYYLVGFQNGFFWQSILYPDK